MELGQRGTSGWRCVLAGQMEGDSSPRFRLSVWEPRLASRGFSLGESRGKSEHVTTYGLGRSRSNVSTCSASSRHCRASSRNEAFAVASIAFWAARRQSSDLALKRSARDSIVFLPGSHVFETTDLGLVRFERRPVTEAS
jgi:hypothetical protein